MAWEPKDDIDRAYQEFELRVGERAARHERMVLATIAVLLGLAGVQRGRERAA